MKIVRFGTAQKSELGVARSLESRLCRRQITLGIARSAGGDDLPTALVEDIDESCWDGGSIETDEKFRRDRVFFSTTE